MTAGGGPTRTCLGCRQRLPIGTLIGVRRGPCGLELVRLAGWALAAGGDEGERATGTVETSAQTTQPVVDYAARDSGKGGYVCPNRTCVERAWRSRPRKARAKVKASGEARGGEGREDEEFAAAEWLRTVTAEAERCRQVRLDGLRRRRLDGAADPRSEAWQALVQRATGPDQGPKPRTQRAKAWSTTRGSVDLGSGDDPSSV